jgi:hypothetical protein
MRKKALLRHGAAQVPRKSLGRKVQVVMEIKFPKL